MAIKKYKPTSPAPRFAERLARRGDRRTSRTKPLLARAAKSGGRNKGRSHHDASPRRRAQAPLPRRSTSARQDGVPAKVETIEYDPNRSANIALLHYADGEKRYILAPHGLGSGDRR